MAQKATIFSADPYLYSIVIMYNYYHIFTSNKGRPK